MSRILYFTLEQQEDGQVPICVLEDGEVLGWTSTKNPSDVEYAAWSFVEKIESERQEL